MEQNSNQPSGANGLRDAIVTLPKAAIVSMAVFLLMAFAVALGLALYFKTEGLKSAAAQLAVVMVPIGAALLAAIGLRQTSTKQIDRLITGFLEETMLERFQKWCQASTNYPYPFKAVALVEKTQDRSYAYFNLAWANADYTNAVVGIKTNVFNFEVLTDVTLDISDYSTEEVGATDIVVTLSKLDAAAQHPVLKFLMGTLQGSVNEGYEVRTQFFNDRREGARRLIELHISLRQKLRENFLSSPYLRRYFAEDAAIVTGVLYSELHSSGLLQKA